MRVPASTYRLQITERFDLAQAARALPYLHDLGVDWVYLSPLLSAEPGSDHGYDVVSHDGIDPVRGGADGLAALSAEARRLGLGVLVDIVPNHVGVATPRHNAWWWDLLTHGRSSHYADAFDVDWDAGGGRIRIPVVGDDDVLPGGRIGHLTMVEPTSVVEQSSSVVEQSSSVVERSRDHDALTAELRYHDHAFPVAPGSWSPGDDPDEVHARQHYELVNWRMADDGLNYRRFFAVNTLAGIRVEDRRVFEESHAEIRRWFDEGLVDGLRVDHPDGLRDPASYLDDLAELTDHAYVLVEKILEPGETLPTDWATAGTTGYDALGLIDRVLTDPAGQGPLDALETRLRGAPVDWPEMIHGTKRAVADGILRSEVRRIARELEAAGPSVVERSRDHDLTPVEEAVRVVEEGSEAPRVVEEGALRPSRNHPSEGAGFETGAGAPSSTSRSDSGAPSSTSRSDSGAPSSTSRADNLTPVEDAVAELLACFPVYRSYLPEGRGRLGQAFAAAREHRPDLDSTYDVLEPLLSDPANDAALRFQQTSGMVMAKGVEDCAFYRWSRLTSLNEVGGDPSEFSLGVDAWHAAMAVRQREWPHAMTTTSTHDTKRGEDVRARITVLAELPEVWEAALERLLALAPLPDPGFGSLLWQAVVGAWPASRERLHGYAEKAMREAGDRTTWTAPDAAYESAVHAAVDAAFDSDQVREVLDELLAQVAGPGWSNALSAKLVALTMPGVPDVYQGSELWEQSLVDPDNRRPVDLDVRREVLARVRDGERPVLTSRLDDRGDAKLLVTQLALTLRRNQPHRFTGYAPVAAHGEAAGHVLAFDRGGAVAVATRMPVGLSVLGWGDTTLELPEGTWADLLTGREYAAGALLGDLLADLPVALLIREDA